jgi:sulfur relay (sulfurtransferase) DsrF/TusC family protein
MPSRLIPGIFAFCYTSAVLFYAEGVYLLVTTKKADISNVSNSNASKSNSSDIVKHIVKVC